MEQLHCVVERVTFQNPDNGFSVLRASVRGKDGRDGTVTIVGDLLDVHVGAPLQLEGEWRINRRYGNEFVVTSWQEVIPVTEIGLGKYLGSGLIKGIGPRLAEQIVAKFKTDTVKVIEEEPERLAEIHNIGKKRIRLIHESWMRQREIHNVMIFLRENGMSPAYAAKIYKKYGNDTIKLIKANPYRLADEVWGIGFLTADRVAFSLGFTATHLFRCRSGILYTLKRLSDIGHVYYPENLLLEEAFKQMDVAPEPGVDPGPVAKRLEDAIAEALGGLAASKGVIKEDDKVYLPQLYYAEKRVAERLVSLLQQEGHKGISPEEAYRIGRKMGMEYDSLQAEALSMATKSGVMVLTGGPGTGKTTIVKGVLAAFRELGRKTFLAAPTGRAAKRMEETTGQAAKTIHRLLEYAPGEGFRRNRDNPLEGDALIVDECSMIDISLMDSLLAAVPDNMSVLFVGDADQLPSVGPGNVLLDMIHSGTCPVVCLKHIFRQAMESMIVANAHRVNQGYMPLKDNRPGSDFYLIYGDTADAGDAAALVVDLVSKRLPKAFGVKPEDIQVLAPMKKGAAGTEALNVLLQQVLNPGEGGIMRRGAKFRPGDKVMQLCNNYDKDVFNGDIGIVAEADEAEGTLVVNFDGRDILYDASDMDEVTHAYAMTIHKSQGSEYPVVVMPLLPSHYVMLQRNLLYTGITRARKAFVLVGSSRAVSRAVHNHEAKKRYTSLQERLSAFAGKGAIDASTGVE